MIEGIENLSPKLQQSNAKSDFRAEDLPFFGFAPFEMCALRSGLVFEYVRPAGSLKLTNVDLVVSSDSIFRM